MEFMIPREEKYIYDWETKRSKGKWSYISLTALVWGTMFPVIIAAFKLAIKGLLSIDTLFANVLSLSFLSVWIKFVAGFFFFALFMWFLAKKKYQVLKRKQAQQELGIPQ